MSANTSRRILLAAAGLTVLAAGCGKSLDKQVVAEVEGRKITVGDMVLQYRGMNPTMRPFVDTLEGKRGFLNDLINREIMLIAAEERNLSQAPEIVAAAHRFEDNLLAERYYIREVRDRVKVQEAEVRRLYEMQGEEARLRLLVLGSAEEAAQMKERLDGGEDFVRLARRNSIHETKSTGGDLGFHTWADYPPEVTEATQGLKEGEVSPVFKLGTAYAIARMEGRRPVPQGRFEDEEDALRRKVAGMAEARLAAEWTQRTQAEINVQVNQQGLETLLARMKEAQGGLQFKGQGMLEIPDDERTLPLASFTGHSWTIDDYLARLPQVPIDRRPHLSAGPEEMIPFIEQLAVREAAVDKARELGLQNDEDIVNKVAKFREKQVVTYLHHEVAQVGEVTEEDMQRFYEENRASLIAPARANIRQVVFRSEEEAKEAHSRVKRGETSMKALAEEESIDLQSAAEGGLITVTRTAQPSALEKAVFETEINHVGGPVPIAHGRWVLFRVNGVEGESQMSFEDAQPTIRQRIADERRIRHFDEWLAQQLEEREIKIHEDVLAKIEFGTPTDETPEGAESPDPLAAS